MHYDFGNKQDTGGNFTSTGSIIEEHMNRSYKSLYYGTVQDKPLEFTFQFGPSPDVINNGRFLDRWDMEAIANWLTGTDGYKWLEVQQPDMETVRYHCVFTDLKYMTVGWLPWAFEATVRCDSPFAYVFPETYSYNVHGSLDIKFYNRSTYSGYYYPKMRLSFTGGDYISIVNHTDDDREFAFSGLPNGTALTIDINENGVITSDPVFNLYPYFNFNFLRLKRGDNLLTITGNCNVELLTEFPLNVGS